MSGTHSALVSDDFLEEVTDLAIRNFRQSSLPVHEFADLCFLRMADHVDPIYREEIIKKIGEGVFENLQLDHDKWMTRYFMKPYWFAMSPDKPLPNFLQTRSMLF
jgi:hypothetical protein